MTAKLQDYYKILEVHPEASPRMIKTAEKALLSAYHPDHNPDRPKWAHKKTQEILEAYAVLGDERRRADYDRVFLALGDPGKGNRPTAVEDGRGVWQYARTIQNKVEYAASLFSDAMLFCPHCGGRLLVRCWFRSKLSAEAQLWKEAFQALRDIFHRGSKKVRNMFWMGGKSSDDH